MGWQASSEGLPPFWYFEGTCLGVDCYLKGAGTIFHQLVYRPPYGQLHSALCRAQVRRTSAHDLHVSTLSNHEPASAGQLLKHYSPDLDVYRVIRMRPGHVQNDGDHHLVEDGLTNLARSVTTMAAISYRK